MLPSVSASPTTPPPSPPAFTSVVPQDRTAGFTIPSDDVSGGGLLGRFKLKETLLYGAAGAILGVVFPVIPGGPIGGALIGAALANFL